VKNKDNDPNPNEIKNDIKITKLVKQKKNIKPETEVRMIYKKSGYEKNFIQKLEKYIQNDKTS